MVGGGLVTYDVAMLVLLFVLMVAVAIAWHS